MKKHNRLKKGLSMLLILAMVLTMSPVSAFASTDVSGNETRDAYGVDTEWYNYRNNQENNGITDSKTPIDPDTTSLKWAGRFGTGWSAAPTPPIILNGKIYLGMSNKVIELDKETGEKLRESDAMIGNVGFAMNPITYADGKIFVQIQNGIVQALDLNTLKCVWHTPKIGGQTVSPISHVTVDGKGYVYTGTFSGESADGSYICFSTDDSDLTDVDETKGGGKIKALKWRFTPATQKTEATENVTSETCDEALAAAEDVAKRGFYWAGAYVTEKYVAVGSDNGAREDDQGVGAVFYTLNPMTGKVIDRITGIKGDIRTTTVYDNGYLYFATKGGILYKARVSEDGYLSEISSIDIAAATGNTGAQATASPLVYGNKIYMGVKGPGGQFDADGGHSFKVIDNSGALTQDSIMYEMPIPGYPQAAALATTAYVNEDFDADGNADGRVYIYFTYNAPPGGIYYCYDTADQTESKADQTGALYIPPADKQQYCISTICADREGTLYYKNDSCYLMAIEKNFAKINNITVTAEEGNEIKWDKGFDSTITEYELTYPVENQKAKISLDLAEGISATIDGEKYTGEVEIDTPKETKTVTIIASSSDDEKDYTKEYTLKFRALSDDSSLGGLKVGTSNSFGSFLEVAPVFDSATDEYFADTRTSQSFWRVWLKKSDANATIEVTGDSNVSRITTAAGNSTTDGHDRWNVYKVDPDKSAVLDVKVTAEDGRTFSDYKVTLYGNESTEVTVSSQLDNAFIAPVKSLEVSSYLAESYGYEDKVKDGTSTLDALVAEHKEVFGDDFTKSTSGEYLNVSGGYITKMFGEETTSTGFAVNGKYPKAENGVGTNVNATRVEDRDWVQFFFYQDLKGWSDNICEISINEDNLIAGTAIEAKLTGYSYAWYGHETDENIAAQINPISNAQFALIDENGAVTPIEGAVTDEDGCATFSIDAAGTYLLTAYTEPSEDNGLSPLIMPVKKITVDSHNFTEEVVKDEALASPATCENDAVYFKSCECGAISTTDTFIAEGTALGHSFTKYVPDGNATCTTDGTKTAVCDREGCDEKDTVTDTGSAGHRMGHDEIKNLTPATTSAAGSYEKVTVCDDCGEVIDTKTIAVPKIGTVNLSKEKLTYTGSGQVPTLTVKDADGNILKKDTDYIVSGLVKKTSVGRYKVTVTFKGNYSGTETLYFTIVPKAPASAKAALTSYYGTSSYDDVKFSWAKVENASGYTVYYKKASEPTSAYKLLKSTTGTYVYKKDLADGVGYTFKVVPYYKDSKGNKHESVTGKTATVYTLKKLSAPTLSRSGSKVKVKWININGESGYQISRSTSKRGTNIVSTYATTSGTYKLISATKGKTYYYKVRAYKTVDGKKIYGPWSYVKAFKR